MDFKAATDALFDGLTHAQLASTLECSLPAIRQARLSETSKAFRKPPKEWKAGVIALAETQIEFFAELIEELDPGHTFERVPWK